MAPPTQRKLVLVTGISGYLGFNVAYQLLKAGYAVRGHYPLLELVNVDDIFKDDLTEALKGVYALIHVATALPGVDDATEMIRGGTEGTRHILNQAYKAGVRKATSQAVLHLSSIPI
ncbi:hypothetical protein AX16_005087 [Volvariella volvacea WC 439]|nr:hypothetical protein AX16_005087 [Volvariella volvacea WC 439]